VSPLSAQSIAYEDVEEDADHFEDGGERSLFLSLPAEPLQGPLVLSWSKDGGAELRGPPFDKLRVSGENARDTSYGPFRLIDEGRVALMGVTDAASPAQFAALLRDHPGVRAIEMVECPGTEDDLANLRLGRMIRAHGIATHVPDGGSVRSGGVELFLAGARRQADPGAEFAVHSWQDDSGREPDDYAASAPENRRYLDYYREMGMSPIEAEAFYAMTNAAPFDSARWFGTGVMGLWVDLDPEPASGGTSPASVLDSAPTLQ
jgi:hypothetical protein